MPPQTPNKIKKYAHFDTPQKAGMQAIYSYCKANGLPCTYRDVAAFYSCSTAAVHRAITGPPRRHLINETRGHEPIISDKQLEIQTQIFEEEGFEARAITHQGITQDLGVEASRRTIVRSMARIQYHMCIACRVSYLTPQACRRRVEFARVMLEKYPNSEDWRRVRFSDETHFGFGPEDRVYIWRKDGERYQPKCIQHKRNSKDKDYHRLHAWAAIGYNFKSELVFYTTANSNGKMSQAVYIDAILEPIVKPWLEAGQDFVLEEDNDSGHGTGKDSTARRWKNNNGLVSYFNCSQSPDLSPIENAWQSPKSYTRRHPHWDEDSTKALACEGWDSLNQDTINRWIDSIPERLQAVINAGGKMTAY
ncbi:hypothetical protein TWF730_011363 [Orbilia blumenaviensis]|uniref:Tc1-like transposase DDE domain-containing protein n=1 Tax=Orbilia blumenaviensis TaxID=1796055 RepID=A0AAV9VMU1_9PEZI